MQKLKQQREADQKRKAVDQKKWIAEMDNLKAIIAACEELLKSPHIQPMSDLWCSTPKHNARNAGRRKNDDAWKKRYLAFCDLVRSGASMEDVMGEMEISRSTYFRFLRLYREDHIAE